MNVIPDNIRSQLAPGWSGINIALMVIFFIFMFPLGLLMLAYILLGESLGLDLGRPETFTTAFERIGRAISAGVAEFNGETNREPTETAQATQAENTAATEPSEAMRTESQNLQADRESLQAERRRFEAEREAFYQRRDRDNS